MVVTGPRFWNDLEGRALEQRRRIVRDAMLDESTNGEFTLVHGNALGLDRMCAAICAELGFETIAVPYFGWMRGAGGPVRNKFMLTAYSPRMVHGFHDKSYQELPVPGSGTGDCVKQALALHLPVTFHVTGRYREVIMPRQERLFS